MLGEAAIEQLWKLSKNAESRQGRRGNLNQSQPSREKVDIEKSRSRGASRWHCAQCSAM